MNFAEIYHKTEPPYCYPRNEKEMIVNIKTGYDVERVWICYGDPYSSGIAGGVEGWSGTEEEIIYKKNLKYQRFWTTTVIPKYKRLKYYFILESNGERYYYYEDGIINGDQQKLSAKMFQYFIFPWMNPSDIAKTPDWVNHMVWYQIFPDRFCNGNPARNSAQVKPWKKGKVKNEDFYGGDLEGIIKKLDYLKELGVTGIYLTPIFESPSTHKYDTKDYMEIDPQFGDKEVFGRLVEEMHKRDMKIMLDGVFNHCGTSFPFWKDVVEKGPDSPYFDWFMVHKWPFDTTVWDTRDGKYDSFAFAAGMPKLNTNNPDVVAYFQKVCSYWVENFDIDGIRFDVGNEVSHQFLKTIRKTVKSIKPDIYLLGEIWNDASLWLVGDEYDSVMNYPLTSSINDFWIDKSLTKVDFEHTINRCYTMYMQQNNNVLFNLLDSHDTDRLFSRTGDEDAFYQELCVLFTMPGSPCIFYGTEIAMEGGHDPDCRRCMPWDEIEAGKYEERIAQMKQLITLRKGQDTFRSLHFHFPNEINNPRVIEYIKLEWEQKLFVYMNCSKQAEEIPQKEVLFARKYENGKLLPGGVLIQK